MKCNIACSQWVYLCHLVGSDSSCPAEGEYRPLEVMDKRTNCPQEQDWMPRSTPHLQHYQIPDIEDIYIYHLTKVQRKTKRMLHADSFQ